MYLRDILTRKIMTQIVLKSSNDEDLNLLLHLADRLNIRHVAHLPVSSLSDEEYARLQQRILTFSAPQTVSFGDASNWQNQTRGDRPLPWQAK